MQVKERIEEMRLVLKAQADCNAKSKDEVFLFLLLKQKEREKNVYHMADAPDTGRHHRKGARSSFRCFLRSSLLQRRALLVPKRAPLAKEERLFVSEERAPLAKEERERSSLPIHAP